MVSIFAHDDHPLMRLKQAQDWQAIKAVMIKHWQKLRSGSWVVAACGILLPLLVLIWVKECYARRICSHLDWRYFEFAEVPLRIISDPEANQSHLAVA
jgi:hypothetical protein